MSLSHPPAGGQHGSSSSQYLALAQSLNPNVRLSKQLLLESSRSTDMLASSRQHQLLRDKSSSELALVRQRMQRERSSSDLHRSSELLSSKNKFQREKSSLDLHKSSELLANRQKLQRDKSSSELFERQKLQREKNSGNLRDSQRVQNKCSSSDLLSSKQKIQREKSSSDLKSHVEQLSREKSRSSMLHKEKSSNNLASGKEKSSKERSSSDSTCKEKSSNDSASSREKWQQMVGKSRRGEQQGADRTYLMFTSLGELTKDSGTERVERQGKFCSAFLLIMTVFSKGNKSTLYKSHGNAYEYSHIIVKNL